MKALHNSDVDLQVACSFLVKLWYRLGYHEKQLELYGFHMVLKVPKVLEEWKYKSSEKLEVLNVQAQYNWYDQVLYEREQL